MSGFTSIDEQADPGFYVDLMLMADNLPNIQDIEALAVAALRLEPGHRVLDVGCGTGEDTRRLAALVGPGGTAMGVDVSKAMVEVARARSVGHGLPATFDVVDGAELPFPDNSFDAVRAERVLIHCPDPQAVLAEMVRVLRPGGRIVAIDVDFDLCVLDLPDLALTRRTISAMSDSMASGTIGRQLVRRFRALGLTEPAFDCRFVPMSQEFLSHLIPGSLEGAVADGLLDRATADACWQACEAEFAAGGLFSGFPFFMVAGTKP
ncbi:MAG TPA: methyltransferase domain-containing protein [Acidimicrobiia bacterium]|nr:methyltransferase domain-containing protein [Acidimicrobiia bacterium]